MDAPLYILDIDDNDDLSGVDAVGLVDRPAIELGWMAFSKQSRFAVANDEEQVLAGAFMVADLPIPRIENGQKYYVAFPSATIKKIFNKVKQNNTRLEFNINHVSNDKVEAYMFGDFLVNEKMGLQAPSWHKELPEGSWFGFVKIPNKEAYQFAKENLTGFSVEGYFVDKYLKDVDEELLEKLKQVLI